MPFEIVRNDITKMHVDAIVNTANPRPVIGLGVDSAIHEKAGVELLKARQCIGHIDVGHAAITPAYQLDAKFVIHTVGPVWMGGDQDEEMLLRSCYVNSLRLAVEWGCQSIAFPLISSGTYGYPKDQVLRHATQAIQEFLEDHELDVYLCVFDRESYEFSKALRRDITHFIAIHKPKIGTRYETLQKQTCVSTENASTADDVDDIFSLFRRGDINSFLKEKDKSFAETLFDLIDERGMTDVECYKRANVDKKTFSKIKCNPDYKPSKKTAVAFCIALRLNMKETQHLLKTAGMTLSKSNTFDLIIEYHIQNGIYDIYEINEALFELDQVLLGQ